jgi:hypothetical protein
VFSPYVNKSQADRVAEGFGDRGHSLGVSTLDVGVDERF